MTEKNGLGIVIQKQDVLNTIRELHMVLAGQITMELIIFEVTT